MVKCKVITEFYDNVEGINRKKGEKLECTKERADYLSGNNKLKLKVAEIIEVVPEEDVSHEAKEEKPKKKGRKKIDTVE